MSDHYYTGSQVDITLSFFNSSNVPTSPTTVVLRAQRPDGTVFDTACPAPTAGVTSVSLTPTVEGKWTFWGVGSGALNATTDPVSILVHSIPAPTP